MLQLFLIIIFSLIVNLGYCQTSSPKLPPLSPEMKEEMIEWFGPLYYSSVGYASTLSDFQRNLLIDYYTTNANGPYVISGNNDTLKGKDGLYCKSLNSIWTLKSDSLIIREDPHKKVIGNMFIVSYRNHDQTFCFEQPLQSNFELAEFHFMVDSIEVWKAGAYFFARNGKVARSVVGRLRRVEYPKYSLLEVSCVIENKKIIITINKVKR